MLINRIFTFLVLALLVCLSFECKLISSVSRFPRNDTETPISQLKLAKINYPIRFTYVNKIRWWWPPEKTVADLGVPGFAKNTAYNYIALAFWLYP